MDRSLSSVAFDFSSSSPRLLLYLSRAGRSSVSNFIYNHLIIRIQLFSYRFNMQYSSEVLLVASVITNVLAHGVIDSVTGANGVTMPGLSGKAITSV
jgi:hypothetical protein